VITPRKFDKRPSGDPIASNPSYWAIYISDRTMYRVAYDKHLDPLYAALQCFGISNERMLAVNLGTRLGQMRKKIKTLTVEPRHSSTSERSAGERQ
jgi:hypothetical protein